VGIFTRRIEIVESEEQVAEVRRLEKEVERLNGLIREKTQKNELAEERIAHNIQLAKGKQELELEREKIKLEAKSEKAIAAVKDDYRKKLETSLQKQIERGNEMYSTLLERLPDVNVALKGRVGD